MMMMMMWAKKNVWTSNKSWEPDLSHTLSFNHSRHAEQVLFSSLCWKLTVYCWKLQWFFWTSSTSPYPDTFSLSPSLTLTLSYSHTLSISHSITLDMLNNFCFDLYAQKSLFIAENCNGFFLTKLFIYAFFGTTSPPSPVSKAIIELVPS